MTVKAANGCVDCEYFHAEHASYEEGGYLEAYRCDERPFLANLKTFPFKKQMPCFTLAFWHSEFAEQVGCPIDHPESYDEAVQKWKEKYWSAEELAKDKALREQRRIDEQKHNG